MISLKLRTFDFDDVCDVFLRVRTVQSENNRLTHTIYNTKPTEIFFKDISTYFTLIDFFFFFYIVLHI